MNDIYVNRWGSLCSIAAAFITSAQFLVKFLEPSRGLPSLSGVQRVQALVFVGLAAAALHGILWAAAEKALHSKFEAGGTALPSGWSAVVLSTTMTVPLALIPPIYGKLIHSQIVMPGHALAASIVVLMAAFGHIFLYGSKLLNYVGIRNIIFPLGSPADWRRALGMELIYAFTHFVTIVLIYRIVVYSRLGPLTPNVLLPALISGLVWWSGTAVFIFLKYPASIVEEKNIEVRGIIHALMLMITLTGGMLM